jgi:hypothetical protein
MSSKLRRFQPIYYGTVFALNCHKGSILSLKKKRKLRAGMKIVKFRFIYLLGLLISSSLVLMSPIAALAVDTTEMDAFLCEGLSAEERSRSSFCDKSAASVVPESAEKEVAGDGATPGCQKTATAAGAICQSPEVSQGMNIIGLLAQGSSAMLQGGNNAAEACKQQANVGDLMTILNAGWAASCGAAAATCQATCAIKKGSKLPANQIDANNELHAQCGQFYKNSVAMAGAAAQFKLFSGQAKNCEKAAELAEQMCATPESMSNPQCQDFCARNPSSPICIQVNCSDPEQKASNPQCFAFNLPDGSDRVGDGGEGTFGSGSGNYASTGAGNYGDGMLSDFLDGQSFNGSDVPPGSGSTQNPGIRGGGGGAPLGGGGGGGGKSGGGGYPAASLSDGGSAGGSGGGSGGGGGGFPGGGGGYGDGGGDGDGKKNLKDFLPFGKLDPNRKLAALGKSKSGGVSGANGLSNWEKVSRRMRVIKGRLQN